VILDGEAPIVLAPQFVAVPTPGHTKGHCVLLYRRRYLFTGDHLAWDRHEKHLEAYHDYCWYSWPRQVGSMRRMAEFPFEWVLPGHGQRVYLPGTEMRRQMEELVDRMGQVPD
jgi:glyoxylase-like metal-dependent hydrolase (beta-lactamase superfamily II)